MRDLVHVNAMINVSDCLPKPFSGTRFGAPRLSRPQPY